MTKFKVFLWLWSCNDESVIVLTLGLRKGVPFPLSGGFILERWFENFILKSGGVCMPSQSAMLVHVYQPKSASTLESRSSVWDSQSSTNWGSMTISCQVR